MVRGGTIWCSTRPGPASRTKQGIDAVIAAQLSDEEDDDLPDDAKAAVLRDVLQRARQPNLSFFAFTATPKFKTKALFDESGPSGASPFHEYSMRQAIEEGFIMDVLANYTTYKRFFGLIKQVEDPDDPGSAYTEVAMNNGLAEGALPEAFERDDYRVLLVAEKYQTGFDQPLLQIIPYQDSDLERLYTFVRDLLAKLPPPGDGQGFVLDDEVALRYFRLQQMTEGSIDLAQGEANPLKGPTDVGTAGVKDDAVALSSLIDRLNERFGTDFTEADQLFFDQIRATAEIDEKIAEAARTNNFSDFAAYLDRMLDELFIAGMEGNEDIFSRVMTDTEFRSAAHEHLAFEIFRRVREKEDAD